MFGAGGFGRSDFSNSGFGGFGFDEPDLDTQAQFTIPLILVVLGGNSILVYQNDSFWY